jgi:endonuclease G
MIDAQIRSVLNKAKRAALSTPGIKGVDYGYIYKAGERTEEIGIRFHVERKLAIADLTVSELIPKNYYGLPCDVLQAKYSPQDDSGNAKDIVRPLRPGISIGNKTNRSTGTLGIFVKDKAANICILSNWHVLVGSSDAPVNKEITQPGPEHFGMDVPPTVAYLLRWLSLDLGLDAAVASLAKDIQYDAEVFGINVKVEGVKDPELGMHVVKSGSVSAITYAIIDGVEGSFSVDYSDYGDKERWMDGFHLVKDVQKTEDEVSLDGDSGSVWFDPLDNMAVALNFAGEDGLGPTADYALGHPLTKILKDLSVDLL